MSKIKKVLFLSPHFIKVKDSIKRCTFPLGLSYIASILEKNGFTVGIVDIALEGYENEIKIREDLIMYGLAKEEIKKRIEDFSPDVVGVSCAFSSQSESMHSICKMVKDVNKKIIVIVGGIHPSSLPKETIKDKNIDYIVIGEGELSFLRLLKNLERKKDVSKLSGICLRKKNKIIINSPKDFIENLDELPFPAWHLLNMEKYLEINLPHNPYTMKKAIPVMTSRGCFGNCCYCSTPRFWGRKVRGRSPKNVIKEIESLIKRYDIGEVQFIDDNLTFNRKRVMTLFRMLKKLNVLWCVPNGVRVDTLDFKMLETMKKSGCYQITIGMESGNEYVLHKIIKKHINLEYAKKIVSYAKKIGLFTHAFFMIGLPGETKSNMKETFDYAIRLNTDSASFSVATPLPNTELFEICKKKKYLATSKTTAFIYGKANIRTPDFTPEYVEKLAMKFNRIYNSRLKQLSPKRFKERYSPSIKKGVVSKILRRS